MHLVWIMCYRPGFICSYWFQQSARFDFTSEWIKAQNPKLGQITPAQYLWWISASLLKAWGSLWPAHHIPAMGSHHHDTQLHKQITLAQDFPPYFTFLIFPKYQNATYMIIVVYSLNLWRLSSCKSVCSCLLWMETPFTRHPLKHEHEGMHTLFLGRYRSLGKQWKPKHKGFFWGKLDVFVER